MSFRGLYRHFHIRQVLVSSFYAKSHSIRLKTLQCGIGSGDMLLVECTVLITVNHRISTPPPVGQNLT